MNGGKLCETLFTQVELANVHAIVPGMAWLWGKRQQKDVEFNLQVTFLEEGDSVVAYAPALDISTCGKNKEEAKANFQEMVTIFFDDLVENKTTEAVLTELGWKKGENATVTNLPSWIPPTTTQEGVSVKVPVFA